MEFLLWALRLPTNVEREVRGLQQALFREHGLASALALPALAPLLCLRGPPRPCTPADLADARIISPGRFRAAGLGEAQDCLLLRLEPQEALRGLAAACRALSPRGAARLRPAPLPCALGIFLCFLEGAAPIAERPDVRFLARQEFPGLRLSLLHITGLERASPWWSALAWEELSRLPLRRNRGSSA